MTEAPLALKDGDLVLFQGDSITDAGRRNQGPEGMGNGYVLLTSAWIAAAYPERKIQFLNRGVGGEQVMDLQARWKEDCLDLKPTWVSLLIGVNDAAIRKGRDAPTPVEEFEQRYRDLLNQTRDQLKAQILIVEPFVLQSNDYMKRIREEFLPKIEVVRKLAKEYDTHLVPMDTLYQEACKFREPTFWSEDGVHPTWAGHALLTQAWLETVRE